VPAVAPHAAETAPRLDLPSVTLTAATSPLAESISGALSKLKLVLSPTGSGSELLLLPESVAKQVADSGINSVPNTFIEAGRTAGANLVSDLNAAASASALTNPLDGLLAAYNAVLKFLGVGAQGTGFTSLFSLVQSVGNLLGLPVSVIGSILLGQSASVPKLITTFTTAAQTALQNFPASVAAAEFLAICSAAARRGQISVAPLSRKT